MSETSIAAAGCVVTYILLYLWKYRLQVEIMNARIALKSINSTGIIAYGKITSDWHEALASHERYVDTRREDHSATSSACPSFFFVP